MVKTRGFWFKARQNFIKGLSKKWSELIFLVKKNYKGDACI